MSIFTMLLHNKSGPFGEVLPRKGRRRLLAAAAAVCWFRFLLLQQGQNLIQLRLDGAQHLILPRQGAQHRLQRIAAGFALWAALDGMGIAPHLRLADC